MATKRVPETGVAASALESGSAAISSVGGPEAGLGARLETRGLTLATSNQVERLFLDPRRDAELVVFVDARDAPQYEAGHIPGAYLLDPYRPEHGLASALAVCATAEQMVVYCPGGDCEDSELAAGLLLDSGIPGSKILVYGGGCDDSGCSSALPGLGEVRLWLRGTTTAQRGLTSRTGSISTKPDP